MDLVNFLNDRLLFAISKKGRLNQVCIELLSGSDIQFHRRDRLDIALVKNLPLAVVFLPASHIPTFVGEGRVDLGITGRDVVAEYEAVTRASKTSGILELMDLGFGHCKLQIQIPEKGGLHTPESLVGKTLVTSFTGLSEQYFRELENKISNRETKREGMERLKTTIKYVGGSVEAACALGVADGIVDLVESGETMRAAGLKAIATVIQSTAVLISSKDPSDPKLIDMIVYRIQGVLTVQKFVLCSYNFKRKDLANTSKIAPGKRAPTVTSLGENDAWVAVQAMVEKKKIASVMDDLSGLGATDIVVTKIHNTR